MEVRKANQQIIQPEIPQKSEVSKTKNAVQNLISDSFEKENSKSSSSNSSSTASAEPEKKAGQITSGILIKQMTAARIGETNAKQSGEVSGKKDLSPEEQANVSNSDPQKKNLDPSSFLQDARSKDEDRKNSGLQPPFASNKGDANSKFTNVSRVGKDQVINATGSDQTSNAVKDANRFADGGSIRSQVDAEVAERHQDSNAIGGSTNDRLSSLLDPTAKGEGKSSPAYGKGMFADQVSSSDETDQRAFGILPDKSKTHKTVDYEDGKLKTTERKTEKDIFGNVTKSTTTTTTLNPDGSKDSSKVESDYVTQQTTQTKDHEDKPNQYGRTHYSHEVIVTSLTGDKLISTDKSEGEKSGTPPQTGSSVKLVDQENYQGNIPDAVKKTMDYFKQQAIGQKPQSGGETAHTDDNAEADPTVGGRASNLVVQQGNLGLLGNPGNATSQTGPSGGQGSVGSSQSGGNVDFGPDSDQVGYAGPTHQDDPGDVQFGSQEPVVKDAVESKNSDDDSKDSNDLTDILDRNRKRGAVN